jgi:hypothetical protein
MFAFLSKLSWLAITTPRSFVLKHFLRHQQKRLQSKANLMATLGDFRGAIRTLKPSATLVINNGMRERQNKGLKTYKFGFGQSPFPVPSEVVQALKEDGRLLLRVVKGLTVVFVAHAKDYLPSLGLPGLRSAMAKWMNERSKYQYKHVK